VEEREARGGVDRLEVVGLRLVPGRRLCGGGDLRSGRRLEGGVGRGTRQRGCVGFGDGGRLGLGEGGGLRLREGRCIGSLGLGDRGGLGLLVVEIHRRPGEGGGGLGRRVPVQAVRALGKRHPGGRIEVRERGRHDLLAEVRRARQAAAFDLVPAVAACVLATRHAEVEGLVEGVQLLRRLLAVGLAAGRGHRLVDRRVVGHDEVLRGAGQDLEALESRRTGRRGLEGVAGATPFAE
jgi:hypothetical protein